ncbi:hypothetical protein ACWHAU_13390 [Streptomyces albidoflavus]
MGDPGRGTEAALFWHFLLVGLLFVTGGIRRLARAGSRRPFQVAVSVAGVPVVIPALGGLSPVLFTWYGAAFHVRAEYIGVAHVWQFVASAYVLVISVALTLFFLACWGYAQPLFRHPVQAWRSGRVPADYFGVDPRYACSLRARGILAP